MELKCATDVPKKLLRIIPEPYISDEKVPARCPLELFLHGTVESAFFTVWVPGRNDLKYMLIFIFLNKLHDIFFLIGQRTISSHRISNGEEGVYGTV